MFADPIEDLNANGKRLLAINGNVEANLQVYIYYLMGEKAIWLDIARVCGRIFTSRRRVKMNATK